MSTNALLCVVYILNEQWATAHQFVEQLLLSRATTAVTSLVPFSTNTCGCTGLGIIWLSSSSSSSLQSFLRLYGQMDDAVNWSISHVFVRHRWPHMLTCNLRIITYAAQYIGLVSSWWIDSRFKQLQVDLLQCYLRTKNWELCQTSHEDEAKHPADLKNGMILTCGNWLHVWSSLFA